MFSKSRSINSNNGTIEKLISYMSLHELVFSLALLHIFANISVTSRCPVFVDYFPIIVNMYATFIVLIS